MTTMEMKMELRQEGGWYCAYMAPPEGAKGERLLLGQIRMRLAEIPERRAAFQQLMTDCFADAIQHALGVDRPRSFEQRRPG